MQTTEISPGLVIQGFAPPPNSPFKLSNFKLIAFDMDSTLINIECIDEIADAAGRKAQVAAITEAAMRGEITDFKDSLRRRLALLEGVSVASMEAVYAERLQINPGAKALVDACKAVGMKVLLVSGGFTFFADKVQKTLGIDYVKANVLEVKDGKLTGKLVMQPWGEICDGEEKRRTVLATCESLGFTPNQAIAMGDGANDLPMMKLCEEAGGLSVAYHAKPKVRAQAMVAINSGGLDRLLDVFSS
jgi:phosphoserine phosphatase